MPPDEEKQTNKSHSLNIELGCKLSVQFEGLKERLSSFLIGIVPNSYLLIKTPAMQGIDYLLSQKSNVVIRYVHLGEVFGFYTNVTRHITNPTKIIFLSYPQRIEKINLRKNPRISCMIPAILNYEKDTFKGIIENLSTEGVKFMTKAIDDSKTEDILIEDDVKISFPIPGIKGNLQLNGIIRNIVRENDDVGLGIEFNNKDATPINLIDDHIKMVLDYIGN